METEIPKNNNEIKELILFKVLGEQGVTNSRILHSVFPEEDGKVIEVNARFEEIIVKEIFEKLLKPHWFFGKYISFFKRESRLLEVNNLITFLKKTFPDKKDEIHKKWKYYLSELISLEATTIYKGDFKFEEISTTGNTTKYKVVNTPLLHN